MAELARERPAEVALLDPVRALGWHDVDLQLEQVAGALTGSPRVAVFAENAVETVLAHLGSLLGGVSAVPINVHLSAREVAYILADSGADLLLVGPSTVDRGVEAARQAGITVVGWRTDHPGARPWEAFLDAAPRNRVPQTVRPRPPLMYTSGTTGVPKGTELPPTMFGTGATVAENVADIARNPLAALGPHLVVGPLYHTGPLSGARLLLAGVPVVVLGHFDAERTLAAIHTHRVESSIMVPTHFIRLLGLPEATRRRYDVSSLRLVAHTGSACPVDVKRAMIDWFGPVLVEAYGATEVGTVCSIDSSDWMAHPGSVGRPVDPFEVVVLDDALRPVPAGVAGRLYFRDRTGRGVVYHNDPEKSRAAHAEPGVFTLGEVGYVDSAGFVYLTDRFSDLVVSGGVNIYPAESEQVLQTHPAVADVACIGVPHPEMGEELVALVVPADPASKPPPDELLRWCRDRLSHYKCPRGLSYVDSVGRTPMGKVNKHQLRAAYGGGS